MINGRKGLTCRSPEHEDGKLVLPRGADHRQVVLISEDSSVKDVNVSHWKSTILAGRTNHQMKSTGKLDGRENVFVFHNVSSTFRFRALGGDDVTEWVEVLLVEPPAVIELEMQARLPSYAGVGEVALNGTVRIRFWSAAACKFKSQPTNCFVKPYCETMIRRLKCNPDRQPTISP